MGRPKVKPWVRSPSEIGWRERERFNQSLPCVVSGCTKKRHGIASGLCDQHKKKAKRWGHPEGKEIPRKWYELEMREVDVLLRVHENHTAIKSAIAYFEELLNGAVLGHDVPARRELRHLRDQGVTGKECLRAVLGLYLYSVRHPAALPNDVRLTHYLAHVVIRLRELELVTSVSREGKYYQRQRIPGKTARVQLGEDIRKTLGVFFVNAIGWLQKAQAAREGRRMALREPIIELPGEVEGRSPEEGSPEPDHRPMEGADERT